MFDSSWPHCPFLAYSIRSNVGEPSAFTIWQDLFSRINLKRPPVGLMKPTRLDLITVIEIACYGVAKLTPLSLLFPNALHFDVEDEWTMYLNCVLIQ